MPFTKTGHHPDAPTRQAETINRADDRFEREVFYIEASDTFLTIDYHSRPTAGDFVATKWLDADTLAIERYEGHKPYIGVVVVLELYTPPRLNQWPSRFRQLIQLLTIFNMISTLVSGSLLV